MVHRNLQGFGAGRIKSVNPLSGYRVVVVSVDRTVVDCSRGGTGTGRVVVLSSVSIVSSVVPPPARAGAADTRARGTGVATRLVSST